MNGPDRDQFKLRPDSPEIKQAKEQMARELAESFDRLDQALQDGSFEKQVENLQKAHKRRMWWGYISLSLTILGMILLWKFLLPITLLKVGIFCLWLAAGMLLNR